MSPLWIVVAVALLIVFVAVLRGSRARQLERIRDAWGTAVERPRQMEAIAASHASRLVAFTDERALDERTWRDLNLDEVFATLDRTESTLGQHALYHRLRSAPLGPHLAAFESLVHRMVTDAPDRERAQLALARLQDGHGYDIWWLTRPGAIEQHTWYVFFPVLTLTALVLAGLAPFWSPALALLLGVLVLNIVLRYFTDFQIGTIARSFRQCAPVIATAEALQFLTGDEIDPIVGPLRTDGPTLGRLKLISRWLSGDPLLLSAGTHPLLTPLSDLVHVLYEYLNLAFLLDASGVYLALDDLSRHGGALARTTVATGDIDAAISIASFRAGRSDWTRPDLTDVEATTELSDLCHPLVENAVPNSIALQQGRGVLVTGSNMSGKSTFLRTVGVNAVLAQTINTCLARTYRAPVFDVRSCIGRTDDLLAGKSYYIAEVEALLELVRASGESAPHLFLLDELFRGTNAVERIAAGQAVLQELLGATSVAKPHVVIAATHDGELVDLAARYDAYHFGDSIGPEGLIFDHRLQSGPATTRNAIALLRLHGAPHTLLTQAVTTAEMLDRQRGSTLVAR